MIATGSSSFELAGQVGEPLTGRKHTLTLYPLAQAELLSLHNRFDLRQQLEDYLLFGTYPDAVLAETRSAKIEVVERLKQLAYTTDSANFYFWRTYDQQEIDWVEERGEQLRALEFKWTRPNKLAAPKAWQSTYPGGDYAVITPDEYQDLLLPR